MQHRRFPHLISSFDVPLLDLKQVDPENDPVGSCQSFQD